ncbi:hypothetical protein ACJMK2_005739 [Sinanodonta woodiana]|uniref:Protein regulator of cytokinesis 1 n=1 Tax=Sinanodonta woodiana TaxID=1069815 RepID=A0ABD3VRD2_SINWO
MATPSKEQLKTELTSCLDLALTKLHQIWNVLGLCDAQRRDRTNTVLHHLRNLLDEMVNEEETLKDQIIRNIKEYTREMEALCQELAVPEFELKKSSAILQQEKDLRAKLDSLKKEKQERLRTLKKLKDQDQVLCDVMSMTPYYIPTGCTPTSEQLQALEKHVNSLTAEKEKRFKEFVSTKQKIVDLFLEMDRNPDTDLEREVLCEEDQCFILSVENMSAIKVLLAEAERSKHEMEKRVKDLWDRIHILWERLSIPQEETTAFTNGKEGYKTSVFKALKEEVDRCEKLKFNNMQKFVEGMRKELVSWWDKCFYSDVQREYFKPMKDDNYTEELLELHEKEVNKMKEYYDKYSSMLQKVERREKLFTDMVEFETKASDPNRFFNDRGGKFLQEEKARKKITKELPKMEAELREEVAAWEKEHGEIVLIYGKRVVAYLEQSWINYNERKVKEKEERIRARNKMVEEEVIYGSKPSTPAKRRLIQTTPSKTPKIRKLDNSDGLEIKVELKYKINDTSKTPASCSKIQHSSVFNSPYGKTPMSASKVLSSSKVNPGTRQRRRSNRLARKVLGERNTGTNESVFSHTAITGSLGDGHCGGEVSLASMGSYQEFSAGVETSKMSSRLEPHHPSSNTL